MDPEDNNSWHAVARRLQASGSLSVSLIEVGEAATDDDIRLVESRRKVLPPAPMLSFYRASNGVQLLWDGTLDGEAIQGSVNIVSLRVSAFRSPQQEDGAPLEGVLWSAAFPAAVRSKLQRMAIFESIAGRSAFLTYFIDEADARLHLVEQDRIQPIVPDFATALSLLKRHAGAGLLREHLTHKDWQKRIAADPALQRLAAL